MSFTFKPFRLMILIAALSLSGGAFAQEVDSSKYENVTEQLTVSTGEKIEVLELFWFGCGHCFALEPGIKNWLQDKPENVEFVKMPAIFTSNLWEFHGKAFYTMKALDAPAEAYDEFFNHLHVKRLTISNVKQLSSFLLAYGKSEDEVTAAFNSFAVDNQVRAAKKATRQAGATGVPTIVVDGKYRTSQSIAGSTDEMFTVINQLTEKAAAER